MYTVLYHSVACASCGFYDNRIIEVFVYEDRLTVVVVSWCAVATTTTASVRPCRSGMSVPVSRRTFIR